MERRPLHPTIGVEIDRQPRTAAETAALRQALDERHLILLRGDRLPGVAQVAFAARFGPLVPERELWGYASNDRPGFPATAARTLQRVTIGAYAPSELIPRLDELLGRS